MHIIAYLENWGAKSIDRYRYISGCSEGAQSLAKECKKIREITFQKRAIWRDGKKYGYKWEPFQLLSCMYTQKIFHITCVVVVVFYNGFSLGNYRSFSKSPLNIWMITTLMRIPFSQLYLKLLKNFVKSKFKMLHIFSEIKIYPIRTPITSLCSRSTIRFVIRHVHS